LAAIGTPMTGRVVLAAIAPAKCAARPAAAIINFTPDLAAFSAKSAAAFGVRWAEIMRTTGSIPKSLNCSMQPAITSISLWEPITTATELFLSVAIFLAFNFFQFKNFLLS
jgi:hypothetical protein